GVLLHCIRVKRGVPDGLALSLLPSRPGSVGPGLVFASGNFKLPLLHHLVKRNEPAGLIVLRANPRIRAIPGSSAEAPRMGTSNKDWHTLLHAPPTHCQKPHRTHGNSARNRGCARPSQSSG